MSDAGVESSYQKCVHGQVGKIKPGWGWGINGWFWEEAVSLGICDQGPAD